LEVADSVIRPSVAVATFMLTIISSTVGNVTLAKKEWLV
jgi:hypothetical protein